MKLPQIFERYRAAIDAELRSVFAQRRSELYDSMRYHLGWIDEKGRPLQNSVGKALRPTLCLLACEAVGGDFHQALPAAAAIELVHNFSLIHDDIQDEDRERRHRPTVWSLWGKPQAINSGTAMRVLASLAMLRLAERGIAPQRQIRAQRILDESCLSLIEGQWLDLSFERRLDIGVADYLKMIEKKTAALISCSLEIGALLGTEDEFIISSFRDFGQNLGLAFQIRDDILGIWGEEEKTGKPQGSDIYRKKKSLPIVYALERAKDELKTALINIYQGEAIDNKELNKVLQILQELNAQDYAQRMAEEYLSHALESINKLRLPSWALDSLEEVAQFLTKRDF